MQNMRPAKEGNASEQAIMRITVNPVFDIETMRLVGFTDQYDYDGPVELLKADGTAKDQLKINNALVADQLAQQKAIRDKITGAVDKYLTGNIGYGDEAVANMTSQFLNQNSQKFNQAGSSVLASLRARGLAGGDTPAGGDMTRGLEALQGARAQSESQGVAGIKLSDLQQALANKFNAASVESGQSAQIGSNISTFSHSADNSLDQYVKAANTGFGNAFTTALGSSLGQGIGKGVSAFATGGLTALTGMLKPQQYTSSAPGSGGGSTNWGGFGSGDSYT